MPLDAPVHAIPAIAAPAEASRLALDPRTRRLLEAPIAPLLPRLAGLVAALSPAFIEYGLTIADQVGGGAWFRSPQTAR